MDKDKTCLSNFVGHLELLKLLLLHRVCTVEGCRMRAASLGFGPRR